MRTVAILIEVQVSDLTMHDAAVQIANEMCAQIPDDCAVHDVTVKWLS